MQKKNLNGAQNKGDLKKGETGAIQELLLELSGDLSKSDAGRQSRSVPKKKRRKIIMIIHKKIITNTKDDEREGFFLHWTNYHLFFSSIS